MMSETRDVRTRARASNGPFTHTLRAAALRWQNASRVFTSAGTRSDTQRSVCVNVDLLVVICATRVLDERRHPLSIFK